MIADYVRAHSIDEVLTALGEATGRTQVIAGGTDLITRLQRGALADILPYHGVGTPPTEPIRVVDISNVRELDGIAITSDRLRIGAATRLADIERSPRLVGAWRVLADGAARVGSPQIRNLATLGGNVCNASPAADTIPPLLVLDAAAEILSVRGRRIVPLAEFFVGPGRTVLETGEFLASLLIPRPPDAATAIYLKHSPRQAMDLSVVGVAVLLAPSADATSGRWLGRIALGAVAPTPVRAWAAEEVLSSAGLDGDGTWAEVARQAAAAVAPIDDIRASAEYRRELVAGLTERALRLAASQLA
jgi:CO/xanthine dehydrogenase FAD-binding subunit